MLNIEQKNSSYIEGTPLKNLTSLQINNGTVEALKWLALLLMTVDHVNRFFFDKTLHAAYYMGRLAMPLFAFILAYNLARPNSYSSGRYKRMLVRLFLFGLLATPAYHYLNINQLKQHYFLPLNIMFSLWVAAALLFLYEKKGIRSLPFLVLLFLISGFFIEYNWIGVAFCISAWLYCKQPSLPRLALNFISLFLIGALNGNQYAMLLVPIIILATNIEMKVPRLPYFFYSYYPLHLTLFCFLKYT